MRCRTREEKSPYRYQHGIDHFQKLRNSVSSNIKNDFTEQLQEFQNDHNRMEKDKNDILNSNISQEEM